MSTEAELRQHRCSFTGHRPNKLRRAEDEIKSELEKEIRSAISQDFRVFITGLAQGVDIWAAQIVLKIRDEGYPVRLICASPFEGFECGWQECWQRQYRDIIRKADLVRYISKEYSRSCFQRRNQWMVDHSARVIAVFTGEKGGTKNTIVYANKVGVPVRIIQG